jgi:IS30 family transposase
MNKQKIQNKEEKKGSHIRGIERLEISILLSKKYSLRNVAKTLKRSVSSISDEIKYNSVNGIYDPRKAQHKAYVKRKYSKYQGMKIEENDGLRKYVEEHLQDDWSPEQIAGRLKYVETNFKYAGKGAIYKFIYSPYGRNIEKFLRKKGKKKKGKRVKVDQLKNRLFIEQRPVVIDQRGRYSDWEGDFIVSGKNGKGALLILRERKAQYTIIKRIMSRSPLVVNQYIQEITGGLACFNSLTLDNDISFKRHEELSKMLGAPIYFCHPYHAWEKGGVENGNGLIRQYVPKSCDISKYTDEAIKKIEFKLNTRPRKSLRYKTPLEVMQENNQFKNPDTFVMIDSIFKPNNNLIPSVRFQG